MVIGAFLMAKNARHTGFTCAQCRHKTCLDTGRPCPRVEAMLPHCKTRRPSPRALPDGDGLARGINCRLPSEVAGG